MGHLSCVSTTALGGYRVAGPRLRRTTITPPAIQPSPARPSPHVPALADQHWHALPAEEVVDLLETDAARGLDLFAVQHRLEQFGPNQLTPPKGTSNLVRFARQFLDPLVLILLAAGVVTLLLRDWIDAGVIIGVVLLNAFVGYLQEAKAVAAIEALRGTMTAQATVVRAGEQLVLPADELVPGDIVLIQAGDKVPADVRLLQERELRVDESALTGESVPVDKDAGPVARDCPLAERVSLAFASSLATNGTASGVVVATGDATEVGKISQLISSAEDLKTPLTRKIEEFSKTLLWIILALGGVTFVVGLLRGEGFTEMFKASIALAVAAIPEGLPAAVTITLAIGVGRMAKRRAIIRKLPAVEALGSTTVICTDKTGTLTQNQMTVRALLAGGATYELTGTGYAPEGEVRAKDGGEARPARADEAGPAQVEEAGIGAALSGGAVVPPERNAALTELLRAGLLCNDSALLEKEGRWDVSGDPTEGALETAALKAGFERAAEERARPRLDAIPFESQHQYMATLHGWGEAMGEGADLAEGEAEFDPEAAVGPGAAGSIAVGAAAGAPRAVAAGASRAAAADDGPVVYVKGAVEKVLERSTAALDASGAEAPLDGAAVRAAVDDLAAQGLRVLAFARGRLPVARTDLHHRDLQGLTFLGLQAMIDPPRPEAIDAVAACKRAGMTVKMITGDHPSTAAAIAAQIGIADGSQPAVTGAEMAELGDRELIELAERTNVFARVTPEQKLRLVEALQARRQVIAMTGDGVNDAPALKQSDIGVAMGITGTEVAKEAADMVLTDDNFATIEAAVEEGRGVFDNLLKFIAYALPTNVGQGAVLLLAIFLGLTLPILPLQILWINMTTAVLLGLGLAFEAKEPGIMTRPPRAPGSRILSGTMLTRILLVGMILLAGAFGLFEVAENAGLSDAAARTLAVNTFMAVQIFYLFNSRTLTRSLFRVNPFGNRIILLGIAVMIVLQLAFTYLPFMNTAFDTEAYPAQYWAYVIAVGVGAMLLVEAVAAVQRRVTGGRAAAPSGITTGRRPAGRPGD